MDVSKNGVVYLRRYSNRKLYSSRNRGYVTLVDIRESVRAGHKVVVIQHGTDADVTALILAQALAQDLGHGATCDPEPLVELLRASVREPEPVAERVRP